LWTLDITPNEVHKEAAIYDKVKNLKTFNLVDTISKFGKEVTNGEFDLKNLLGELN